MKRAFLAFFAAIMVAAGDCQVIPALAESQRQVWAFYLGFWAGPHTWEWQAPVLDDAPALGLYNSKMPDVAARQIDQAKSAGIDAFLVSWFGLEDRVTTTPALDNLLNRAAERGDFAVGAVVDVYEEAFNREPGQLAQSLRWLVEARARHPAYLRYQDRPVILFAFQDRAGFSDETWQALRQEVDPGRQTIWIAEGLNGCCLYGGAMDGMYAFNMAWANGISDYYVAERNLVYDRGGALYIPSVSPGWDERKIARLTGRRRPTSPRDRAGGQFLARAWDGALATKPAVVLIVTWNEFVENSHVEPSVLYGTQALDTLRPLIAAWKGAPPPRPKPLPRCFVAHATESAALYAAPDMNSQLIGRLEPGRAYDVTGEDNGLYRIASGGVSGYAPGEAITIRACPVRPEDDFEP